MSNKHIGSDFDELLKEEGIREEVTTAAIKRVIAWQLAEAMKRMHITPLGEVVWITDSDYSRQASHG